MIEFWYDFGSPASYLAWTQLERIREETGQDVAMKPMLLGGVFKATGNASPVTVPAKGAWMRRDMARWAVRYDVPLNMPPNFPVNTLNFMRAAVALEEDERLDDYVTAMFEAMFARGEAMDDMAVVARVLTDAGFDADEIFAAAQDDGVKARLIAATEEAVGRGVFGAPTFFVGKQMHFGNDRIDWVIDAANAA